MNLIEKQIKSDYIFKGKIINLRKDTVELPNGKTAYREIVEHNGGVCIAPLTKDGELIFVKQYRCPYDKVLLELPAGKRETTDTDTLKAATRELKEETGAVAGKIIPLGEIYPTPAYCGEIIYLYLGTDLTYTEQKLDDDEFLSLCKIPLNSAVDMVMNGEIKDSKTQIAVLKIKQLKDNGKI